MKGSVFVGKLLDAVRAHRANSNTFVKTESNELFKPEVIKHWLNFAVYYERASVLFISSWLKTTPEDDALHYFAHQIEDECNHYRWLKKHLAEYVQDKDKINNFVPPNSWKYLMEDYYPNLGHLVERLAAHNIASETGAIGFMEYGFNKFPNNIKETVKNVMKDERYHVSFGCKLLARYCTTEDLQELAWNSTFESMDYMERARKDFVNI